MNREKDHKPVLLESRWQHHFEQAENEPMRHHVYTGFVVMTIDDQYVVIKRELRGDNPQASPSELEQQIIEWGLQTVNLLAQAQQFEITTDRQSFT
jgi:hypothetical protein